MLNARSYFRHQRSFRVGLSVSGRSPGLCAYLNPESVPHITTRTSGDTVEKVRPRSDPGLCAGTTEPGLLRNRHLCGTCIRDDRASTEHNREHIARA